MFKFKFRRILTLAIVILLAIVQPLRAQVEVSLGNISRVAGVRENELRGYGIVVGLEGTGDGGINFINRSIANALKDHGINVQNPEGARLDNVAAVMVTATLPPFKKPGDRIDVTVSSIGNAGDLSGGVLLETPLIAGNDEVYAVAQGPVSKGGDGEELHKTTVTISEGALVERKVPFEFVGEEGTVSIQLDRGNFTTASRVARAVNSEFGDGLAQAENASSIRIQVPENQSGQIVDFISTVQNLEVNPASHGKVVVNERTGTVVMGQDISVRPVAITHRDISLQVEDGEEAEGETVKMPEVTTVDQVVKSLNGVGASTDDVIAILQVLHRADALSAPLELM